MRGNLFINKLIDKYYLTTTPIPYRELLKLKIRLYDLLVRTPTYDLIYYELHLWGKVIKELEYIELYYNRDDKIRTFYEERVQPAFDELIMAIKERLHLVDISELLEYG